MPVDPQADETRQIEHVTDDLAHEFSSLPRKLIDEQVSQVTEGFQQARVRSFVPVLVRRGVRERLRQITPV